MSDKPSNTPRTRRPWLALAIILAAGFALRLEYLAELRNEPAFEFPAYDAAFHDYWARALLSDDWSNPEFFSNPEIHTSAYFRPPAYPVMLAGFYAASGGSFLFARVAQMLLGLVNAFLAYLLARELADRATGLLTAAGMSCYWAFVYFEGELLAPVLLVTLMLTTALALLRWYRAPGRGRAVLAGLALGVFALARPNALVIAPVAILWALWLARRRGERALRSTLLAWLPLGLVLGVAPATVRNLAVTGDFVLVTANAGVNFYIGNNERTDCVTADIPILDEFTALTGWTCFDQPEITRGVEQLQGRKLRPSEVSRFFAGKAWAFIAQHPGTALRLAVRKALLFWGPAEISNNKQIQVARERSAILRWLPGFPPVLALAAVGGLLLALRLRREGPVAGGATERLEIGVLLAGIVAVYFASHLPFFVAGRYRVPVVPLLLVFAAFGVRELAALARARRFSKLAGWCALAAVLLFGASTRIAEYSPDRALWHFDRGDAYRKSGDTAAAVREFRAAIEAATWPDPRPHNDLGAILLDQKQIAEAIASFEEAVRIHPGYLEARGNLAGAYLMRGDGMSALPHLELVVSLDPGDADAVYNLGTVHLREGNPAEAVRHLRTAALARPDHVYSHYNLALALIRQGQEEAAIAPLENAIRVAPGFASPYVDLARLRLARGERDGAADLLRRALGADPRNAEAARMLQEIDSQL